MRWFESLRVRLIIMVALALLPALGVAAYEVVQSREEALGNVEDLAELKLATITSDHREAIASTHRLLLTLSELLAVTETGTKNCTQIAAEFHAGFEHYTAFGRTGADGLVDCLSIPYDPPVDTSDRSYFQRARDSGNFSVGDYAIGRVTGQSVLVMALPQYDSSGGFEGVLFASLSLDWLVELVARLELSPGTVVSIVDPNGIVLARFPSPETWVGQDASDSGIYQLETNQTSGFAKAASFDGVDRHFAFETLRTETGQVVGYAAVGLSDAAFIDPIENRFWREIQVLAVLAAALLVATSLAGELMITRPVAELRRASGQLARSKFNARAHVSPAAGDLATLATQFNMMAADLERQYKKLFTQSEQLRNARDNLEQRVRERTAELEKANDALAEYTRRLANSNTELEQFAYVASHDLQEPLRTVAGYTELLRSRYADQLDEKARHYMNRTIDGTRRMQQLIRDLLTYSRVTTRAVGPTDVPLNKVMEEVAADLEKAVEESHGRIVWENLPTIRGDRDQIRQVLLNLVGNGLKFRTDEPPQVRVEADRTDGEHIIKVSDNGIGIDPKYHGRLFTVFQRLHTREEYSGTGIGLALCKKIVERHGGEIWVESEPGQGSTFRFTIPDQGPTEENND